MEAKTILVVDDNPDARRAVVRTLELHGYRVLETGDPSEVSALASRGDAPPDLLVTDVVMPEKSGITLAAEMGRAWPNIKTLFISGYADRDVNVGGLPEGKRAFLEKPFSINALAAKVAELLAED